ncbi:MAG: GntR family transcriptional regulator [Solirubrobacteraceae bacterium]
MPRKNPPTRDASSVSTKAELAHSRIEAMIMFRDLPPGGFVSEARLAERIDLGRTPVREALQRLASEGLIEVHPKRGILIVPLSVESQLQVLEIRRTLEGLAVRLAAQRSQPQQRAEMAEVVDALKAFVGDDPREFAPLLKGSHGLIAAATQNPHLPVAMAPLHGLSRRFWFANLRDVALELRRGADFHVAMLTALCEQDEGAAVAASRALNDYLVAFAYATVRGG